MSGFDLVSVRLDESETVKKAFCHFVRSLKASRRRPSVSRPTGRLTHEVVPVEEEENVGLDFGGGVVHGDVCCRRQVGRDQQLPVQPPGPLQSDLQHLLGSEAVSETIS